MQTQISIPQQLTNSITHGDCIQVMGRIPANSVDFILTDPPYLVNYRDRDGRTIQNDANADWLKPAMREAYAAVTRRSEDGTKTYYPEQAISIGQALTPIRRRLPSPITWRRRKES